VEKMVTKSPSSSRDEGRVRIRRDRWRQHGCRLVQLQNVPPGYFVWIAEPYRRQGHLTKCWPGFHQAYGGSTTPFPTPCTPWPSNWAF
jgi:hypothetical protein